MLKFAVVLLAAVVISCLLAFVDARKPKWNQLQGYTFDKYVRDFQRDYAPNSVEYTKRKALFDMELASVIEHNKDTTKTWKNGINHYSDLTHEEKRQRLYGFDMSMKQRYLAEKGSSRKMHKLTSSRPLPKTVDYRNAVPPVLTTVKDQGQCGSCWAHATVESIETAYAQVSGELFVLSQQQIASCTTNPDDCGGSGGCGGGIVELGIDTVGDLSGLNQEWSYPYLSYMGTNYQCKFWKNLTKVWTEGYVAVQSNNAGAVMDALAFAGPLAISGDASHWSNYEAGVFAGCSYTNTSSNGVYGPTSLDHAIQMVGYGEDTLGAYWIVRNSWSTSYGEEGYIRIARYPQGEPCGMAVNPQDGNGCKGQTAPYYACGMCGVLYETLYANPRYPANPF